MKKKDTSVRHVKIGVVGCGMISSIYLKNCTHTFDILDVVAVADLVPELAQQRAEEFNIPRVCTVEQLLTDPEIEIVLNLTTPKAHAALNLQALAAGKHVYTEKPFALTHDDADSVLVLARSRGLGRAIERPERAAPRLLTDAARASKPESGSGG